MLGPGDARLDRVDQRITKLGPVEVPLDQWYLVSSGPPSRTFSSCLDNLYLRSVAALEWVIAKLESTRGDQQTNLEGDPPPDDPAMAGATHTTKGTPKGPGRRHTTKLTPLERRIWTLYERHQGEPSPFYEVLDILKPDFSGLTHGEVRAIVRKIKARKDRASRKPVPRGH